MRLGPDAGGAGRAGAGAPRGSGVRLGELGPRGRTEAGGCCGGEAGGAARPSEPLLPSPRSRGA